MAQPAPDFEFDAFISYRRVDAGFAAALERALERYSPPRNLGIPNAHLRVFRDESDIRGSEYFSAIEGLLRNSRKLIVVCSPEARASEYVDDEIRRFVQARGAENVLSLIVSGSPNNEAATEADKAFPEALCEAQEMPLATSFIGFNPHRDKLHKGAYSGAWYTLLAGLLDVSRAEIEERDRRREQRRRRILGSLTASIMVALSALTAWALLERDEASRESEIAFAHLLAAKSELERLQRPDQLERSVLLGVHAAKRLRDAGGGSFVVDQALREAVRLLPSLLEEKPRSLPALKIGFGDHPGRLVIVENAAVSSWNLDDDTFSEPWRPNIRGPRSRDLSGNLVALGGNTGASVWDIEAETTVRTVVHPMVQAVAIGADGRYLATASWGVNRAGDMGDDSVRVWDLEPEQPQIVAVIEDVPASSLAFSPDDGLLAIATGANLSIWEIDGDGARRIASMNQGGNQVAFSRSGDLVAASTASDVRVWGGLRNDPGEVGRILHADVTAIAFAPDDAMLATTGRDGTARLWDIRSGVETGRLPHDAPVNDVVFGPQRRMITASGVRRARGDSGDPAVRIWEIPDPADNYRRAAELGNDAVGDPVRTLAYSLGDSKWARAEAQRDLLGEQEAEQSLVVRGTPNGGVVMGVDLEEAITDFDISANGAVLAVAAGRTVGIWDVANRTEVRSIGHERDVFEVALNADGSRLVTSTREGVSVNYDGLAWIWNTATGEPVATLEHSKRVLDVDFSADGALIATVADGAARLWSATGELLDVIGQGAGVSSVEIGPHLRLLATSHGAEARVWELDSGREVVRLPHLYSIVGLRFTPDGRYLATASFTEPFRSLLVRREVVPQLWPLLPEQLIEQACARVTRELTADERRLFLGARDTGNRACEGPE